jgi:PAS domain S-box-containing protein
MVGQFGETTKLMPIGRIIIVDDEVELMTVLRETLEGQGYEAKGFNIGTQALAALRNGNYDLLLSDLMMPGMDGITLLQQSLEIDPNLVGIIMTGQGTVSTAVQAMQVGAFDYILKPFKLQNLVPILNRAMAVRRLRLENVQMRESMALYDLSQAIAFSLDPQIIAQKTLDAVLKQSGADEAALLLNTPAGDGLYVAAVEGHPREGLLGARIPLGEGIASWAAQHGETLILEGVVSDPRFQPLHPRPEIRAALALPMVAAGKTIGVLTINNLKQVRPFTQGQIKTLTILANTAATALQNVTLYQALDESEKRFRTLIEHSSDAIALVDREGEIQYASPATTRVLGYTVAEFVGMNGLALVHPESAPAIGKILDESQAGQLDFVEVPVLHKSGEWRVMDAAIQNFMHDPYVRAFVVNYHDVTERKQAEEALQTSETRFRELVEQASDAITLADPHGYYLEVNSRACEMLGYTREEMLKLRVADIVSQESQAERPLIADEELKYGKPVVIERLWRRKDGRLIPVESSIKLLPNGYTQAIVRDISERKETQAALGKMVAELSAMYRASAPLVSGSGDLQSLAEEIAQAVTHEFDLADCGVLLLNDSHTELQRIARAGLFEVRATAPLPLDGPGLTTTAVRTGEIIYAPDVLADPNYIANESRTRSELVVPLKISGQVIGVLDLQGPEPDAFDERARRVIATFAERAALALENARLFERMRHRTTELETLVKVSAMERTALTRAEFVPLILEEIMTLLNTAGAVIALIDPSKGDLVAEMGGGRLSFLTGRRFPANQGATQKIIASQQAYVANDAANDTTILQFGGPSPIPAVAGVPMITQGQVIGVIWIGSNSPLSENEVRILSALADIAANAIQRTTLYEQTQRRVQQLQALRAIDEAIIGSFDMRLTLHILLEHAAAHLGADAVDIMLLNPYTQALDYVAGRGFQSIELVRLRVKVGEGYAGRVAFERRALHVPEMGQAELKSIRATRLAKAEGFNAYYGIPLVVKGQVKGVLELFKRTAFTIDTEWTDFLETLAGQAAIAIDNAQLFEHLQRSNLDLELAYDTTLQGWSHALDLRDRETEGHTQRVTELTLTLARAAGIAEDELVHLRRGALLHDIGKMAIPDSILLKPGPLTPEEWEVMKQHSTYAFELLSPIPYLRPALDIPYCHHEKWDGSGYPRGLKGEQIPVGARLFAVVDVWDALRSQRPYRAAWPAEKVKAHILALSGSHFDPKAVELFMAIHGQGD